MSDHMADSFEEARSERRMSQADQMGIGKDKKQRKKDTAKRSKNKKEGDSKDKKQGTCENYCGIF